jgi:hypothetical protein
MNYQRVIGLAGVILSFVVSLGLCADLNFKSDNEFGEWMTFYYQNPSPERVPTALVYFCNSAMYKSNATMPMAAFFSALFRKDSALMQKTFDEVSLNGIESAKIMFINILSLTNNAESKILLGKAQSAWQSERLQGIIARQLARPHDDLYSISVDTPQVLDMLWASFFATGDDLPVQKIISVLHMSKDGHGEEIIVGGAANWSLKSNAQQHPKVLEICKKELLKAQGETKAILEEIVK